MHDVETLKTLKGSENLASPDILVEQNDDLLITDITPNNNQIDDLLMMDVPVMTTSTPIQNGDAPDLLGIDVPVTIQQQPPVPDPEVQM